MSRNVVPLLAVLAAGAAIAGVVGLESHANSSREAQVSIIDATSDLNELQLLPYRADPSEPAAAGIARRMKADENRILYTVRRLHRSDPLERAALVRPLAANFAVLGRLYRWAAAGEKSISAGKVLAYAAERTLTPAIRRLRGQRREYTDAAHLSDRISRLGSTAVIVLLLGAFSFFYRRAANIRRKERSTHGELEAAQRDRTRLLARAVEAAEDERTRIAGDLHDGPIQGLTAAAFRLDLLGRKLARGETALDASVVEIRDQLAGEMAALRRLMFELRPPMLDEGGISEAIRGCAVDVLGPETSCDVHDETGNANMTPELETILYRVAREAIVNVQKHAAASRVTVTLTPDGDRLQLTVVDDGSGFEQSRADAARLDNHLGLVAMQERVESLGGEWRIRSERGTGTRIDATFPWHAPGSVTKESNAVVA